MKAELKPRINLEGRTPLETLIPLSTPFIVFAGSASSCNFKCCFCLTCHRDMIAELHLEGRRKQNGVCGNCGQLSHCLPDNIDTHRLSLLAKFKTLAAIDPQVAPPGGTNRKIPAVAAE